MTDFRALCAELVEALHAHTSLYEGHECDLVTCARAVLAQPEPQGPTNEELLASVRHFYGDQAAADMGAEDDLRTARAVLARWGRPAIEPVPVSEGMPGPEDVNDDGEVWVEEPAYDYPLGDTGDYDSEPGRWVLRPLSSLDKRFKRRWLPNGALPVPVVEGADG